MKRLPRRVTTRASLFCLIVLALFALAGLRPAQTGATAVQKKKNPRIGNFDIRINGGPAINNIIRDRTALQIKARASLTTMKAATARIRAQSPNTDVQISAVTGSPEVVSNKVGALTPAAPGREGMAIVADFLRENADVFGLQPEEVDGLHFIGESDSPSGLRMVRFEQMVNGVPVFQSETRALLDRTGRLVRTVGLLIPGADQADPLDGMQTPADALSAAMSTVGVSTQSFATTSKKKDTGENLVLLNAHHSMISGDVASRLVYFPIAPGTLIPAWSQIVFTKGHQDWFMLTDARTGDLLWRKNIRADASTQQARFDVYVQADGITPAESVAPHSPTTVTPGSGTQFPSIARTTVPMLTAQNLTASPDGWIPDGGTTTTGNNVDAYLDTNADDVPDAGLLDNNGRPVGNMDANSHNRDFLGTGYSYNPPPMGGNPDAGTPPTDTQFQRGIVTQLFYLTNWYHDQLYNLGFNEAAGNFQSNNFGKGGTGGDPVLAEAQDGSGTDNSNFSTPPDGMSGRMQMFIFDFPTPNRDGVLDSTIVLHEATHGLSNRLIGNGNGLIWDEGGGMGEGWSDFYALSLLHNSNAFDPDGEYVEGAYATYQLLGLTDNYLYGIRRFPYSTNNSINPLTWADVDDVTINTAGGIAPSPLNFGVNGALEVHNVGEVWCLSLWEVRSRIIHDPAGANGDVPTGNHTMLQLVTDALKMTPINPSFTDARDAVLAADLATHAGANEASIWGGFADRGLGYKAIAPLGQSGIVGIGGHVGIGESFSVPYLDATTVAINDSTGNNNGSIDPGEPIGLTVGLFNPWRSASHSVASATAVLTSLTAGVTIVNGNATYGAIAPNATVNGTPFSIMVASSVTCGQSLKFNVQTTSSLGVTNTAFTVRVGHATGNGAPITFTRTIPGGLAIPDDDFRGVTDTLAIPDDMQIADLKFRLDDLHHTFTGDLTVELKAPNGYGTDLIYIRGTFIGDGDGDNFINTVIDGASANDLNLAGSASAPFTGSWLPAFNSPIWSLFGIPNLHPDAVGQLARLNGLSTQGNWKVHVTDEAEADTGTLNTWSLIVTPVAFTCTPFIAFDTCLQDDKTGDFIQWSSHTGAYTFTHCGAGGVTLTGTGTATSPNNTRVLTDNKSDRRITATFANGSLTGKATVINILAGGVTRQYSITQTNTHPTCVCH